MYLVREEDQRSVVALNIIQTHGKEGERKKISF
jgi:hypothetical protein